jgi:hypothetical protein
MDKETFCYVFKPTGIQYASKLGTKTVGSLTHPGHNHCLLHFSCGRVLLFVESRLQMVVLLENPKACLDKDSTIVFDRSSKDVLVEIDPVFDPENAKAVVNIAQFDYAVDEFKVTEFPVFDKTDSTTETVGTTETTTTTSTTWNTHDLSQLDITSFCPSAKIHDTVATWG